MDFSPGSLMAGLVVGGAGFVAFVYGRRQRRVPHVVIGIVLMVFPYFVKSPLVSVAIGAGLLATLWGATYLGL